MFSAFIAVVARGLKLKIKIKNHLARTPNKPKGRKMKKQFLTLATVLALAGIYSAQTAFAEETTPAESHEAHHPDQKDTKEAGMGMGDQGGMMGKMDMNQMTDMMHQCQEMHKDGKMCDHDMMSKCQDSKMNKGDCQKMMKQAKAQEKAKKK
jgi:hypothetical protein